MILLLFLFAVSLILYLANADSYCHVWKNTVKYKPEWMIALIDSLLLEVFKLLICDDSRSFLLLLTYCHFAQPYTTEQCQCHWKYRTHSYYGWLHVYSKMNVFLVHTESNILGLCFKCIMYLKLTWPLSSFIELFNFWYSYPVGNMILSFCIEFYITWSPSML